MKCPPSAYAFVAQVADGNASFRQSERSQLLAQGRPYRSLCMVATRFALPRIRAQARVAMAVCGERILHSLANVSGTMGPKVQVAQNQQALVTQMLHTTSERAVAEGRRVNSRSVIKQERKR